MFLHGFPEAAFVWDELLEHFARPEHGGYRCVAPNLRGFEQSSAPAEVERLPRQAPGAGHRGADRAIDAGGQLACLVAHDWGGAVAWSLANQLPRAGEQAGHHQFAAPRHLPARAAEQPAAAGRQRLHELPDPARRRSPAGAKTTTAHVAVLLTNGRRRRRRWLTEAVKDQYRAVWDAQA